MYGEIYICDHPVYSRCTLYQIDKKGLAVIQQRYDSETKKTWWYLKMKPIKREQLETYFDRRNI